MEASALTTSGIPSQHHGRSPLLRLQSDERLIALVRRGNHGAFEMLVGRYQSRLLAFCRHMLGSREDAEDVLQEVFAAAFNAILADARPINARPWLYRIARNRSLNHLRRVQPIGVDSMDVHFSEHGATTADKVDRREQFRELIADVQELPETQRTALLLREIDALSYEQIAEAMETTIPSVKSLLVRARVSLAEAAEARQLSCEDVRLELGEIAEGLRRRTTPPARRHLRSCERCAIFRTELRATSKALALLLPVGPLLVAKKLLLAHVGLSASAGAGGAGGAAGGAGTAAVGALAGTTAGAAGGGGLVSAGLGALGAKAAAGIAAAALVTAGAVEMDQRAPQRTHPQPQVVAQQSPRPAAAPVVRPAPMRVQRALDAPARDARSAREPPPRRAAAGRDDDDRARTAAAPPSDRRGAPGRTRSRAARRRCPPRRRARRRRRRRSCRRLRRPPARRRPRRRRRRHRRLPRPRPRRPPRRRRTDAGAAAATTPRSTAAARGRRRPPIARRRVHAAADASSRAPRPRTPGAGRGPAASGGGDEADDLHAALERLEGERARLGDRGAEQLDRLVVGRPLRLQHALRDRRDLAERPQDRVAVVRRRPRHLAQEAGAEGDVAVLVARDVREALDEARQRPLALVVVDDEVLAGEREHPLDHHVVDRDRLDERLERPRARRRADRRAA